MACVNALCRRLKKIFSWEKKSPTNARLNQNSSRAYLETQTQVRGAKTGNGGSADAASAGRAVEAAQNEETPTVNVNPFAPIDESELNLTRIEREESRKRSRSKSRKNKRNRLNIRKVLCFSSTESSSSSSLQDTSVTTSASNDLSLTLSFQGLDLRGSAVTRYRREFHELELVGSGEFGSVYRCLNRLDGCVYAVKRSRALAKSNYAQRRATNEVHANAVLNNHRNVVRYYSAWIENDCVSIQQEYCNGGDLGEVVEKMRGEGEFLDEREICRLLLHVAEGLRYVHSTKLAHMDIKPENIFISRERSWTPRRRSDSSTSSTSDVIINDDFAEEVVYKIGDLGHVASVANTQELEDEGDCRYLPKEILREDYRDLTKADIFALGLTIYQAGGAGPLPKNGPAWHDIRDGKMEKLTRYSEELNTLIMIMVHLDPKRRPSAADLVRREFLLAADLTETA